MQYTSAVLALAASITAVYAQSDDACASNYPTSFLLSPVNATSSTTKRHLVERQAASQALQECTTKPVVTINNGVLTDQDKRTGAIVANHQFQFDNPLQENSLFTDGFGVCSNKTLSSQGSAVFYACNSGGFSNLYDESIADYCYQVYLQVIPCEGGLATGTPTGTESATSAPETSAPVQTEVPMTMAPPATTAAPAPSTPAAPFPVPPVNNGTVPVATGTAAVPPQGTTTAPPSSFTGAASVMVAGSKLVAVAAGLAAFFLA